MKHLMIVAAVIASLVLALCAQAQYATQKLIP